MILYTYRFNKTLYGINRVEDEQKGGSMKQFKKTALLSMIAIILALPVSAGAAPTDIRPGSRGDNVLQVQELLIKNGFLSGKADGIYGPKTLAAVRAFQETVKIQSDGIVGTKTLDLLKRYKPSASSTQGGKSPFSSPAASSMPSKITARVQQPAKSSAKPPAKPPGGNSNIPVNHHKSIPMVATAYTRYDEGCTDYTYRGTYLRKGLVAVDPSVIPLGTKLYVPGYGEALADDIGGAIKGNRIDLAVDTVDEAYQWGVRHITVYIIG